MRTEKKVLILGAGLTGLSCAKALMQKNIPFEILEESESLGGRVKTEIFENKFKLDLGFQVILDSYPELNKSLDVKKLQLQKFNSGALIFKNSQMHLLSNPLKHPQQALATLTNSMVSSQDKWLLIKTITQCFSQPDNMVSSGISTLDYLTKMGFSPDFIDFFWRPFLSGVYLDADLSLDSNYFLFLLRCFGLGNATVPRYGMDQLPKAISSDIPAQNFIYSEKATQIGSDSNSAWVKTSSGKEFNTDILVQTFSPENNLEWRSVTTVYLTTGDELPWGRWLVLAPPGEGFTINHLALMSEVSDAYAPKGQTLISANIIGETKGSWDQKVISDLERLAQKKLNLRVLKTDVISKALPKLALQPAGALEKTFIKQGRIYQCGDWLSNPSINFALKSGNETALEIIKDHF